MVPETGAASSGVRVIATGQEPPDFLNRFRLLIRPGELVVAPSREHAFSKDQWWELADHLAD